MFSRQPQQLDLAFAESFAYVIKRQRRKSIALHVLADGSVELRAPKWVAKGELVAFVQERSEWVLQRRREALAKQALSPRFRHGEKHFYLGQQYALHVVGAARASVVLLADNWLIKVRDPLSSEQVQKALEQWYRRQADVLFSERIHECFARFPQSFRDQYVLPSITIRRMRRRWGSCSSRGEVTLNVLLMKMPLESIDYVITHELCHLAAFHHGKTFYQLLERVMPEWRQHKALIDLID